MKPLLRACLICAALLVSPFAAAGIAPGSLDVRWNEGAQDCAKNPQPPLQAHQYDAGTYILRESPCATSEAPFMYLLAGANRALLIDTGNVADPDQMPLARTVMGLLPKGMPLLVVHTHGHLDHRAGDPQLARLPDVQVIGTDLDHVKAFFGFDRWPDGIAQVDLGGRIVDVIPTPGHYPSHVTYYDRDAALFFTGDFFLPGRLLLDDVDADIASARRVADFIKDRPVSHVLGAHVELDAQGELYPFYSNYRPGQHVLQLGKSDLLALPAMLEGFNGLYGTSDGFTMINQTRQMQLLGAAALLALGAILAFFVWLIRRLRRRSRLAQALEPDM
jgi:glyoxylase-like metal-dependent hydrolase (beta-lactamase superfamily II)